MIKHIVFFGIADHAEGKSKMDNMLLIKQELENLQHHIPELLKIEVGINHPNASSENYDLALYSEFESLQALEKYMQHPEHKKVGAYIAKVKTSRACVDYEV